MSQRHNLVKCDRGFQVRAGGFYAAPRLRMRFQHFLLEWVKFRSATVSIDTIDTVSPYFSDCRECSLCYNVQLNQVISLFPSKSIDT